VRQSIFLLLCSVAVLTPLRGCGNPPDPAVLIEERQAGMRDLDTALETIKDQLGVAVVDKAAVMAQANQIEDLAGQIDAWFLVRDAGVASYTHSEAWSRPVAFSRESAKFADASSSLVAAAGANDRQKLLAAVAAVNASCNSCHAHFRFKPK
jgi:cytochrome c556